MRNFNATVRARHSPLLFQVISKLEAFEFKLALPLMSEDLRVRLPLAQLVQPLDLLLRLVLDPLFRSVNVGQVPLDVAVRARAAGRSKPDTIVHLQGQQKPS